MSNLTIFSELFWLVNYVEENLDKYKILSCSYHQAKIWIFDSASFPILLHLFSLTKDLQQINAVSEY